MCYRYFSFAKNYIKPAQRIKKTIILKRKRNGLYKPRPKRRKKEVLILF